MHCISISHKKADASIRERYALGTGECIELEKQMCALDGVRGAVILSTCNRTELYVSLEEDRENDLLFQLQALFADYKYQPKEELLQYFNIFSEDQAIRHLFKVCSGLESKIIGEDEILHQVKQAFYQAKENEMTDYELNVIFQHGIANAKKAKTDTLVSKEAISISTLVAKEINALEIGPHTRVLIIGIGGKIAGDIAKNLLDYKQVELIGTVRSHNPLFDYVLQNNRVTMTTYAKRYDYISWADVVLSATASPHYTITKEQVRKLSLGKKHRLFIDLAIPRDIDPELRSLTGITLHNLEHYEAVSKQHTQVKMEEVEVVRQIAERELEVTKKELLFHKYLNEMECWQQKFSELGLYKLLYKLKKNGSYEEMKTILSCLEHLKE
ncbi:MAG: glutamyl-tRNA reductase [bacterium]|nr:glutamyl-tRNA reductase [bacterium]